MPGSMLAHSITRKRPHKLLKLTKELGLHLFAVIPRSEPNLHETHVLGVEPWVDVSKIDIAIQQQPRPTPRRPAGTQKRRGQAEHFEVAYADESRRDSLGQQPCIHVTTTVAPRFGADRHRSPCEGRARRFAMSHAQAADPSAANEQQQESGTEEDEKGPVSNVLMRCSQSTKSGIDETAGRAEPGNCEPKNTSSSPHSAS